MNKEQIALQRIKDLKNREIELQEDKDFFVNKSKDLAALLTERDIKISNLIKKEKHAVKIMQEQNELIESMFKTTDKIIKESKKQGIILLMFFIIYATIIIYSIWI